MSPLAQQKTLLLETIKIEEGHIVNLPYHQNRCDQSRKILFKNIKPLILGKHIDPPQKGIYRCRILYNQSIQKIEYLPYIEKEIQSLRVVPSNLEYNFKYANRDAFKDLLSTHTDVDDVLIEKEGYLSDTSIANIAFYDGKLWFTPAKPLLAGTQRQKLLDEGFLQPRDIKKEDLHLYSQVALMNAMIGFKIIKNINILT